MRVMKPFTFWEAQLVFKYGIVGRVAGFCLVVLAPLQCARRDLFTMSPLHKEDNIKSSKYIRW